MIRSSCQALRLPRLVLIPRAAASSGTLAMPVAAGGDEDEDKKGPGGGRDGDRSGRPGPAPFHQLLLHPARAAWRSSSRPPPAYLAEVRSGLLLRSGRTGRQLRRTHGRVVRAQAALASRRERERRDLANARYRGGGGAARPGSLEHRRRSAIDRAAGPVPYSPEAALAQLRYRLVPSFFVNRRVLAEARSLLGPENLVPRRILDVGCGMGGASAAALDLWGPDAVEWVHCVDPSRSMRDGCAEVLRGVIDGHGEGEGGGDDRDRELDEAGGRIHRSRGGARRRQGRRGGAGGTRVTLGESVSDGALGDARRGTAGGRGGGEETTGTFDLALCSYTMTELPHFASVLSLAAIAWEKLAPGGVLVVVEPGTPDGFSTVRAVRNMLLDCCPPDDRHGTVEGGEGEGEGDLGRAVGDEECHVIAPCTHNGTCPMDRHRKDHLEKKFGLSSLHGADTSQTDEIRLGHEEGGDGARLEKGGEGAHPDWDDEEEEEEEEPDLDWDFEDAVKSGFRELPNRASVGETPEEATSEEERFGGGFCSFVHSLPGGDARSKGEKFSYLVVQKRITGFPTLGEGRDPADNPFFDSYVTDLLEQSLSAGAEAKAAVAGQRKKHHRVVGDASGHANLILRASELEGRFLDSNADDLALELVRGDSARRGFGRIVRAPVKRKGHVMVDYCAPGRLGELCPSDEEYGMDGGRGRIVRHRVSRGVSARIAPGMFGAARKARWGGLWPHVGEGSAGNLG